MKIFPLIIIQMKKYIFLLLIISFNTALAQVKTVDSISITGKIIGDTVNNDSIQFNSGLIDQKYFQILELSSAVTNDGFNLKTKLSYPHMFRVFFPKDRGVRVWRSGKYFIDVSTNFIEADYTLEECNRVDGQTSEEYNEKFIPFFFSKDQTYQCKSDEMDWLVQNNDPGFDSLLVNYVVENSDSYVALWSLIERFSLFGHSSVRATVLQNFSDKIKDGKLWQILDNDFENSCIKESQKFPTFGVKTFELKEQELNLPKAKYTLIDFWFSRCVPCLQALPALKKLYADYKSKGFEIVSISTDKTENVPLWQKRVKEKELTWLHFLDENGIESEKLSIISFPTTFLLNEKGEIIKKYISPEDLETFLKENL